MDRRGGRSLLKACLAALAATLALAPETASARVARPRPDSLEFRRSWPLRAIGAEAAYAAGYTGRGVSIALVDCGLGHRPRDLARNLSAQSVDLFPQRHAEVDDRHGYWVAQPLGSRLNGYGTVGVAYNATLLEIRADMDGGHEGQCAFWPSDIARALDYAAEQRARIVILPVEGKHPLGAAFEAALGRVIASGAVVVVAAGNGRLDGPAWPAAYSADRRFSKSMVAVGAATFEGNITDWTNRAGAARDRYVLAPGEWILTDCRQTCRYASGTSFAAPFVAGALALVMEAHPELDGPAALERLLASARDLGTPGPDEIYGWGVLDLGKAFAPTSAVAASP